MLVRRAYLRLALVPAALAGTVFCVAAPSAWAQGGAARAAAASAQTAGDEKTDKADKSDDNIKTSLIKAVGKQDGEMFGDLLMTLGDGKRAFHTIAETTAMIKQESFTVNITGRTEMRGNYGSAFVSDAELTSTVGEQSQTQKTKFVSDGQTLWTLKPDENKYTEKTVASIKTKMGDEVMGASFDLAGVLAFEAANNFKKDGSSSTETTYKVDEALFRGVPCRILTLGGVTATQGGDKTGGRFRVFVGLDKRLRGLQLQLKDKSGVDFLTMTELVKVMEAITPAPTPQDALFHFSPPAGAKKVESFEEKGDAE